MLINSQKDSIIIAHLKGDKGIAACRSAGQYVTFRALKQFFV